MGFRYLRSDYWTYSKNFYLLFHRMKYLFLDVDGVLSLYRNKSMFGLSKPCLKQLERIIKETNAKIVLSSTWRLFPETLSFLKKNLKYRELYVYDVTPVSGKRGAEIEEWLDTHSDIDSYVILDDDSDMLDSQLSHFIKTNMKEGLTPELADKAIEILNRKG